MDPREVAPAVTGSARLHTAGTRAGRSHAYSGADAVWVGDPGETASMRSGRNCRSAWRRWQNATIHGGRYLVGVMVR